MSETKARSYANLAAHYRRMGDEGKARRYEAKAQAEGAEKAPDSAAGERELTDAVTLFSLDAFADLAERFGRNTADGISSAVSAALLRCGDHARLAAYLDRLGSRPEFSLKRKTAGYLRDMAAMDLAPQPRVHLLLLSYNRADYVENALRQLAATDYANYAVYIADNASSDGSWDIVSRAAEMFPPEVEVHVERLPTNIGRPAGHNWLLEKYDHSAAEFIAIGDDDLLEVPPSWLKDMIRTARLFPDAAVVGGKALNQGRPRVIHGGVRNILCFGPQDLVMSNDGDVVDYGQFDYIDRVDHVIGCLHIYRRDALLDEVGVFDIRFSPCQYVDIEHHLRTRLKGYSIIYNGLIEFRHLRGMGQEAASDRAMGGNSFGNRIKVLHKYDQDEVMRFLRGEAKKHQAWLGEAVASQVPA